MSAVDDPRRPNPVPALLRNSWRQLTSMRTALTLLFLLAIASIPGSVLPQRAVSAQAVSDYYREHPDLAPTLDRLGAFDAYASVWFSAIYVLLFASLIGCIIPRIRDHWRAVRMTPPEAPRRLDRLAVSVPAEEIEGTPAEAAERIRAMLRTARWRAVAREQAGGEWTVSAERGHLKETGNLVFHTALLCVLAGVAFGGWYGWHGNRILVTGADTAFCNSVPQFDESGLGPRVDDADLPPFCLELTDFEARFLDTGMPESFRATVTVDENGTSRSERFAVNSPLRLDGASVHLLGHGYAPVIRYTDRYGVTQERVSPFLSSDLNQTSEGVAKFPDANVDPATGQRQDDQQIGFQGVYAPTMPAEGLVVQSVHPAERNPGLTLIAYRGNLGEDAGIPNSVYSINQSQIDRGKLVQLGEAKLLRPGESWTLDDGGTVTFVGTREYATIAVRSDPGQLFVLLSSVLGLIGLTLSLYGKRRRVFFRITPGDLGESSTTGRSSFMEAGGLPRTDYPGFADEFAQLVAATRPGGATAEDTAEGTV
ncbi:cytochrome c biogenesis protein [Catenuloplanes nepalensis]|uniref:Cytochrome c biogenesis protein n=1 Tax=Catenuloplanes nepalensis TaxID=587533 RepID=A0ABT9N5J9_9ACTN|nr:cytochrome c biogenesis protein [Catenuloplanes nepalensis]